MLLGIALGGLADGLGPQRSMVIGLSVLGTASALGGLADGVPALLLLRAIEGLGFLLVVLPAPGLVRRLVPDQRVSTMLGVWGTYMPAASALALLIGPLVIDALGWRAWWWALAALSFVMAFVLALVLAAVLERGDAALPQDRLDAAPLAPSVGAASAPRIAASLLARLHQTIRARAPWLVALSFAVYSSQWLAVIGFLPTIYNNAGLSGALTGVLTAIAAGVNVLGNLAAGRLLQRGVPAPVLMRIGFITMGLAAVAAFAGEPGTGLPAWLRYAAVLVFSSVGGLIPGTLFSLAVRAAPTEQTLATTVGWVQQWSAFGQFVGPPLVAWVASRSGSWQWTWVVTGAAAAVGLMLTRSIARWIRR